MSTDEAIKFLAKKGTKVDKVGKNSFKMWDMGGKPIENFWRVSYHRKAQLSDIWNGRDLIQYARSWKDSDQQTSIKKNVKKFSNDKDRTATRDLIKKGDFDNIPQNKRTKEDSLWNWD